MAKRNKMIFLRPTGRVLSLLCFCAAILLLVFPVSEPNIRTDAQTELTVPTTVTAASEMPTLGQKLIQLGRTTGIKLYSEGTMVVGFARLESCEISPAETGGLEIGDVIIALNNAAIESNESLVSQLKSLDTEDARFTILRDGRQQVVNVTAVYDKTTDGWRIGAWIRDSIAGIGTITFVDPETGVFGALGHGICDADTGTLMPFGNGAVMSSLVESVQKGETGKPGQLTGSFELTHDQGVLYCNTEHGIFGRLEDDTLYHDMKAYDLAEKSEIQPGKAVILSNVSGSETKEYEVEILRVYDGENDGRDLMLRVTDPELLAATGGIVQGMSGSPILQNGKLIGAVTHVLVNDPQRGYGIAIQNMLNK